MTIKQLRLILVSALLFAACGNDQKEGKQQLTTDAETKPVHDTLLNANFYKRMEGTIADQPVVVHLQCFNDRIQGMYYYTNHGAWMMLEGALNPDHPNDVRITESNFSDGERTASLDCRYEQGTLKGSWQSADGKKNYLVDLKEYYPEGSYTFTTLSIQDSLAAFPGVDSSPIARVGNDFVIPLNNDADSRWLEIPLRKALSVDTALKSPDLASGVRKMNDKYLKGYRDEVKNMGKDGFAAVLNYEDIQHITICYNENGYVIYDDDIYSYSGGAHGNGGSNFYCLDVLSKKELNLHDVITADSASLQPIVEAAFRKEQGLKPTDSLTGILFENHLATTRNFYFTNKGISFYYFPYEVAAYVIGPINVFVSFASLKHYLNPDFARRMKLQ